MSTKSFLGTFICLVVLSKCCIAVEVTIDQGTLRGSSYLSRNGTKYHGFLSIPFAKPPVGELRFEPPQPPDLWQGIRDATKPPPICIQKEIFTINAHLENVTGQEDCLYLNVYTPAEVTEPVPVMVYIHGGAFIVGSTAFYNPSYFMDHKVIVVVIQYRLNILGFLSTGDQVLPGNNGMKDQVAALKWVQKNVEAFGGDPRKVTIFGESAGAGSVHYHLHSPLSKGLFHGAISQSGTALAVWAHTAPTLARQRAHALGTLTCCPTKNSKALINCLKKIPAEEIVHAHNKFYVWEHEPVIPFSIVMEPEGVDGAFLLENPWHNEAINDVPFMIGCNSADGGVKATRFLHDNGAQAVILNENYKRWFPISFFYGLWMDDEARIDEVTEKLKTFYFGDKDIGVETTHELIRLYTDGYFAYDALEAARRHNGVVYFYYYDHRNKRTFNEIFGTFHEDLGVCHADDLISLFHIRGLFPEVTEGDDFLVSQRLIKYWVNFAYNGNPSAHDANWSPVISNDFEYLHITTKQDEMKKELLKERYEFWKSLQVIPPFKASNMPKFKDEL